MNEKQTRCPKCLTVYKVSLMQLTIAQGMVCCPKCTLNFNALTNLVNVETQEKNQNFTFSGGSAASRYIPQSHILDIFNQKITNSNIDLLTYLNNLNYFHNEPIDALPNLNLADQSLTIEPQNSKKRSWLYYTLWSSANLVLILIFAFQILWFNPKLMSGNSTLSYVFNSICSILHCNNSNEQYQLLEIQKIRIQSTDPNQTVISGVLVNKDNKSIALPNLKLTLDTDAQENAAMILTPKEYLIESLQGIQRIPTKSPFKFKFTVHQSKNRLGNYRLEIVHP